MGEFASGITSDGERRFVHACLSRGFPRPDMQVRVTDGEVARRVIDARFVGKDGQDVFVEVDGAGHQSVQQWVQDIQRQNSLSVRYPGRWLRVTGLELTYDQEPFFRSLSHLVATQHWPVGLNGGVVRN